MESDKSLRFYFSENELKTIKSKYSNVDSLIANKVFIFLSFEGIHIWNDRDVLDDTAEVDKNNWQCPNDTKYLQSSYDKLFIAGGHNHFF